MKRFGWIPDIPSIKDHPDPLSAKRPIALPLNVDWRPKAPPIIDQDNSNSCVGFTGVQVVRFMRRMLGLADDFAPSPMFLYWFARYMQRSGWENHDSGCYIRDAMRVLVADGICPEHEWPFNLDRINERPPQIVLHNALAHKTLEYVRMKRDDNLYHLKHSLAQGFPFMAGISVYTSFMDVGDNGIVPMPKTNETLEGGHAVWFPGNFQDEHVFIGANSWGTETWGDKGYFYLPEAYLANDDLSDDFWRISVTM
jgi:hypothetical protein